MNQQEILEYNKRCAEFLGLTIITDGISWFDTDYKALKPYDSDWNCIMELVEAIQMLYPLESDNKDGKQLVYYINHWLERKHKQLSKKEAVVQAINQFLIWYKENKI